MSGSVVVKIGKCRCPGKPHRDGDTVSLDKDLSPAAGIAAAAVAYSDDRMAYPQRYGLMIESAMQMSVREWTLEQANGDGKNHPIPITPESVRDHLPWDQGGAEVVIKAMGLYGKALGLPFVERTSQPPPDSSSTPTGLTESSSTSAPSATKPRRRKPS